MKSTPNGAEWCSNTPKLLTVIRGDRTFRTTSSVYSLLFPNCCCFHPIALFQSLCEEMLLEGLDKSEGEK